MKEGYYKGLIAEFIVYLYLKVKGYKVLKHRYSNYCGEIDFICKYNEYIVFIEVKFRNDTENLMYVITQKQINRIRRAASIFLKKFPTMDARFDAIFISYKGITHLKNVF